VLLPIMSPGTCTEPMECPDRFDEADPLARWDIGGGAHQLTLGSQGHGEALPITDRLLSVKRCRSSAS
jgi:hypothetical protein